MLKKYSIDTTIWGQGDSKTRENLLEELKLGESNLVEKEGLLVRVERGVILNVYFDNLKLIEDRQVFNDGRVRRRNISTSIGEKLKPKETPLVGARRALKEELGIVTSGKLIPRSTIFTIEDRTLVPSTSFPGLWTKRTLWGTEVTLTSEYYKPEGYVEIQKDKRTHFTWREI